ncbi:hypothetical protein COLO4_23387 [Corchorus olitorius]|uniref:Uncharacterized protein n=1 Tax=Corchorus olitorius TaxID=93759 RepID=A0A1R3IH89_9ROSI|nr:hypothetical protein COLO4_23387 [Corchorus olitorius]
MASMAARHTCFTLSLTVPSDSPTIRELSPERFWGFMFDDALM